MNVPLPTKDWRKVGVGILMLTAAGLAALWAGSANLSQSNSVLGASIADIAGFMESRSPGERTTAELTKLKQTVPVSGSTESPPGGASDRVLGKVFPSGTDDDLVLSPEELVGLIPMGIPLIELPTDDGFDPVTERFAGGSPFFSGGGFGPPIIGGGGSSGGGSGGGGTGGGGGGGESPPQLPPGNPIPAVPEPSTWVLMLMGAAMCGASMRQKRRLQRQVIA